MFTKVLTKVLDYSCFNFHVILFCQLASQILRRLSFGRGDSNRKPEMTKPEIACSDETATSDAAEVALQLLLNP